MRTRIIIFVSVIQSILWLTHWFIYDTWMAFWAPSSAHAISELRIAMIVLSMTFVVATLLAHNFRSGLVSVFYKIAATWLGFVSFFFLASCACWAVFAVTKVAGLALDSRAMAATLFGLAAFAAMLGMVNARWARVTRVSVALPNLPAAWRGRVAAIVSDTHLGHVRNYRFIRRIVALLNQLKPDVVFIPGDYYDGSAVDVKRLAEPLAKLDAPLGAYFVTGNHEEFRDRTQYIEAMARAGVRVLNNEKVDVDGVQIVGVHDRELAQKEAYRSVLQQAAIERDRPSILLAHAPHGLPIAEAEGVSLQVSGHTHGGQFFPFTLIAQRVYRQFVHGLERFGNMLVFTNYGAGRWGPPLRVGTHPEIALIRFE